MQRRSLCVPCARFIVAAVLTLGTALSATLGSLGFAAAIATGVLTSVSVASAQASFTVLHSFTGTDGVSPIAGLIQGPDGTLYGTTPGASIPCIEFPCGTVFKLAPDGSGFTVLHSFTRPEGEGPIAGLVQGPDGTLYGTTEGYNFLCDGSENGTIFRIAPDGSGFTVLHIFDLTEFFGSEPIGSLIQGPDSTLYGTTEGGGTSNSGVVFQLTLSPSAPTSGRVGHK